MSWESPKPPRYHVGGAPEENLRRRLTEIVNRLAERSKGEPEFVPMPEIDPYEEMVKLQEAMSCHEAAYDKRIASQNQTIKMALALAGLFGGLGVLALIVPMGSVVTFFLFLSNLIPTLFFLMSASGMYSQKEDLVEEKSRVMQQGAKDLDKATTKFLQSEGVSTPGVTPEILKEFDM